MKYLLRDEVRGLEKFLVAENREAVGIEIQVGKDWRAGYSEPDAVWNYTLEELDGRDPITVGGVRVCALVEDRLYCVEKGKIVDEVYSTKTEYAYRGVDPVTSEYLYVRAKVVYGKAVEILPEEEVLPLEVISVKENRRVIGVRIEPGSCGVGGSNTSDFSADSEGAYGYTLEELDGRRPLRVENAELCALVGDVLYLRFKGREGTRKVLTLDSREEATVIRGAEIAYDTVSATRISLLLRRESE